MSGSMPHSGETPGGSRLPGDTSFEVVRLFGISRGPLLVEFERVGTGPEPEPDAVVENPSEVRRFGERRDMPICDDEPERPCEISS